MLTRRWCSSRPVVLAGERLWLVAWEVMTDYRINDAKRHWALPSVDFVFLDREGRMVVLELKRHVQRPKDAWSVLCQVTHRAQVLGERYDEALLISAYQDCRSGTDGRLTPLAHIDPLRAAHARAFARRPLPRLPGVPVRRLVMAESFGASFPRVLSGFTHADRTEVNDRLNRYAAHREFTRFRTLGDRTDVVDPAPIRAVLLTGEQLA
jgi:hypothetical protein